MKSVFHFLTRSADPQQGGMQQSLVRVAGYLARLPGASVRIYTLNDDERTVPVRSGGGVRVVHLRAGRDFLAQPLLKAESFGGRQAELRQLEFLAYQGAVRAELDAHPDRRHVVFSFFISQTGFAAQHVADRLGIPHVASIRGSDFSRDFRSPDSFGAISHVVRRAAWLVATNREQADAIRLLGRRTGVTTILNSISFPADAPLWQPPRRPWVHLASDCGYSFKKGTHVLLRAVADLVKEGRPIRLTIVGHAEERATRFWQRERRAYARECPGSFFLEDWMGQDQILNLMRQADLYCSATLGEGCSNARLQALALGMPMLTTRCGEMTDLAEGVGHVRLAEPGDLEGYKSRLREMVAATLDGGIKVRPAVIRKWRARFHASEEIRAWSRVAQRRLRAGPPKGSRLP